tara:strand:+ start:1429 stop:2028 length:600 start_codon:yes stop_codon:yes gene_type:complete
VNKMGNKEGLTMDFAVHSHDDERTAATLTHLVEILGTISNALGTGIDFKTAPITKKPTSKKVSIDGKMQSDKTTLGNKSIPGMAIPQAKPKTMKKSSVISRDFTGRSITKEDIDEVVDANQREFDDDSSEKLLPLLMGAGAIVAGSGEKKAMNPMSTSDGKALLSVLEEAVEALEKFMTTTKVSSASAMKPQDIRDETQ